MSNTCRFAIACVALAILSATAFAKTPVASGSVRVSDLIGSTENGADDKLYERGFTLVDGKQSGEESFKTYYNAKSKQCVMAEIMDNKVISINPTESPNCR